MIHAKLDVDICDHPRALAAGAAAFGLWSWGLAYTRKHELDGELPRLAVRAAFGGGAENEALAERLVAVGLWEVTPNGWRMLRYAEKNETKSVISDRRAQEQERKAAWRQRRSETRDTHVRPTSRETRDETRDNRVRPGSGSDSDSDLKIQERSESLAGIGQTPMMPIELDDDLRGRCAMAGAAFPTVEDCANALEHARAEGKHLADPKAYIVRWMKRKPAMECSSQGDRKQPRQGPWEAAYCVGMAKGLGSPFAWPGDSEGILERAIGTFAKAPDGGPIESSRIPDWVQDAAEDFGRQIRADAKRGIDPKFWSGGNPRGLLKFLNEEAARREARKHG